MKYWFPFVVIALCASLMGCSERSLDTLTIHGTWVASNDIQMVIHSDGSYQIGSQQGTYQLLDNNHIQFRHPGLFGVEMEENDTYNLAGNELTLSGDILGINVSSTFTRQN